MGVNKVDLATGETLIDISGDTVTPQTLAKGYTAHNSNGEPIVGTMTSGDAPSSGSGIIDVTELPTVGIDENAVYRLIESIQTEKTEVYLIVYLNGDVITLTLQQYLASLGVPTIPNIYVVDDLSNMLETDVQTFSVVNIYILKSDGIAYAYVPAYGGIITMGLFGFQAIGYDKGFTENINDEGQLGVYTTAETFRDFIRYFTRKSNEWNELTAYRNVTLPNGYDYVEFLQGEYTVDDSVWVTSPSMVIDIADKVLNEKVIPSQINVDVFPSGDVISGSFGEIVPLKAFKKGNGLYIDTIKDGAFMSCSGIKDVIFPDTIRTIGQYAFQNCTSLALNSLPNGVRSIGKYAFNNCEKLALTDIPASVESISSDAFAYCDKLTTITFKGFVNEIDSLTFAGCYNLTTVNVPWSEGEVANAPWGAVFATINYNYTEG